MNPRATPRVYDFAKRAMDIVGASSLLVVTAPVQVAVALVVAVRLGRPVLFKQPRPGRGGRVFTLLKFRTMLVSDPQRAILTDEQRLTSLGARLRSLSLDELPSLWNVLRGDMSIVGPRPLLVEYLTLYTSEQARRHDVRPGVTGLAQVSGRNALTWEEKFRLDVEYVERRSLMLDLRILLATVRTVVAREGISHGDHVTMDRFLGDSGN